MKFKLITALCLLTISVSGCTWLEVPGGFTCLTRGEENMLVSVYGEDAISSGKLTKEQEISRQAFRNGGEHILSTYSRLQPETVEFTRISDELHYYTFKIGDTLYTCTIEYDGSEWTITDDYEE